MNQALELVVLTGLADVPPCPLGQEPFTVGRLSGCDWVLRHPSISRQHARLSPTPAGWQVEDLGSSNGTWLGGERLTQPALLSPGQAVRLGDVLLLLRRSNLGAGGAPPGLRLVSGRQSFDLVGVETLLGRMPPCGLILPDQSVSRVHARVYWDSGVPWLADSGSRNGTTHNGVALTAPTQLRVGDRFACGEVEMLVDAVLPAPVLWLEGLNLGTGEAPCIADHLRLDPGDLVAMPGAAHARRLRSWLLGLAQPHGGVLLLAGEPLPPAADLVPRQRRIGYVAAEPALLPGLTVAEHLALPLALLEQPTVTVPGLLRRVGLVDQAATPAAQLAAEDRLRLALGLALAAQPTLLLVEAPAAVVLAEQVQAYATAGGAVLVLGEIRASWLLQCWAIQDGRLVSLYVA